MSRARRHALTGLALASAVVLIAFVSPRVGGIEGTGTQVAVPCDAKAETLAALKRCRAERERTGGVLAEVYERVDAREGVRR